MAVIKMNFLSQCLGMQTNVTICLPSYSFKDRMDGREDVYVPGMKYQVLWLLHGGSGDDSDYLHFSNITRYADDHKLAVVMPCDYNMYYADYDNGAKYMSFIAVELPKMLRAILPLSDKREDNFIGGLSMGSVGCQKIAINYPEQYSVCLGMSAGGLSPFNTSRGGGGSMIHREGAHIEETMELAKKNVEEGKELPKFFMTWGDQDFTREGHQKSCDYLRELGYNVYQEVVPGYSHEWDFWDLTLRKAISEWLPIRHSVIYPE